MKILYESLIDSYYEEIKNVEGLVKIKNAQVILIGHFFYDM